MSNEQTYILILFLAVVFLFGMILHYKKKAEKYSDENKSLTGIVYELKQANVMLKVNVTNLTRGIERLQKRIDNVDHVFFNDTEKKP